MLVPSLPQPGLEPARPVAHPVGRDRREHPLAHLPAGEPSRCVAAREDRQEGRPHFGLVKNYSSTRQTESDSRRDASAVMPTRNTRERCIRLLIYNFAFHAASGSVTKDGGTGR